MTTNKKQNKEQKKEKKNHTWKKKEVCLLFPNFKPAFNQTKIQKLKKKKLKHEPNIVEITYLCIRHGVHTSKSI
jgi:hypothetical protein